MTNMLLSLLYPSDCLTHIELPGFVITFILGCVGISRKLGYMAMLGALFFVFLAWPSEPFVERAPFTDRYTIDHVSSALWYLATVLLSFGGFELGRYIRCGVQESIKEEKEKNDKLKEEYEQEKEQFIEKYGELTREFNFPSDDLFKIPKVSESVFVFEKSKKIIIGNECYDFEDIVECRLIDKLQGETILTTKTSTGSMLGRAVVGGVLTGGVGAVVGAATAKQKTIAKPTGNSDFEIMLSVNSIKNPIVKIQCGKYADLANELYAILNLIIKNYQ